MASFNQDHALSNLILVYQQVSNKCIWRTLIMDSDVLIEVNVVENNFWIIHP